VKSTYNITSVTNGLIHAIHIDDSEEIDMTDVRLLLSHLMKGKTWIKSVLTTYYALLSAIITEIETRSLTGGRGYNNIKR